MNNNVITVSNISKKYQTGELQTYKTIRDSISRLWHKTPTPRDNSIWALKDINFSVQEGEILGIIGRNGSGKSTLLKILSKITYPSGGHAEIKGRIGALLEVGTGFHPELTGRENVFLSGAILGMTKKEIKKHFDEIVDFSGVETYIDTPVKKYSSGMRVRLGFAVAAHLNTEILLIDEVLAVGDAAFQKKCLGKMKNVSTAGRTVLFVSHQLEMIQNLCPRTLWIQNGTINQDGKSQDIIQNYLSFMNQQNEKPQLQNRLDRQGNLDIQIIDIKTDQETTSGNELTFIFSYKSDKEMNTDEISFGMNIRNQYEQIIFHISTDDHPKQSKTLSRTGEIKCHIPQLLLTPGIYSLDYSLRSGANIFDKLNNAYKFNLLPGDVYKNGMIPLPTQSKYFQPHHWEFK